MSTQRVKVKPDEQFARLLEISSPIAAGAATDASLGSMAALANALRLAGANAGPSAPDPAFRAALRQRLVAVATVQAADPTIARANAKTSVRTRAHHRVAALAGTFAIVTSVAGVGVAAARSLPGDPFYGIKRATESVQLWAANGEVAKGKRHLEFARTRLAEARALPSDSSHLASTLSAMNSQTRAGSRDLISAYHASNSPTPLADLVTFSHQQYAGLTALAPSLPAVIKTQEQAAVTLLGGVVQQVHTVSHGICVLCLVTGHQQSPNPGTTTPNPTPSRSATAPGAKHRGGKSTTPPTSRATPSHGAPTPTSRPTPSSLLPTGLPSIPLPIISALLHPHHHNHAQPTLTPLPLVSALLGGLGL